MTTDYTFDFLMNLTDEELYDTFIQLENKRDKQQRKGFNVKTIEIDICYVAREIDIRRARKTAHAQWLGLNNEEKESN